MTATITRNPATKNATLAVDTAGGWRVFAGRDVHSIDFSVTLATGNGPETLELPTSAWACFALRTADDNTPPLLFAERHLPMAGGYNFRDLGGFPGADGKHVVWGKLFRTDGLGSLTDADLAYLASIPVATIADFRTDEEDRHSPDRFPASVKHVLRLPIAPGYMSSRATQKLENYSHPDEFMLEMYRDLALDPQIVATYREFFASAQTEANLPLIFHCSAGKDRTGFAAALILHALGVDRQTILADYAVSNTYLGDKYAPYIEKHPHLKGLFTVKESFLEEAFTLVAVEYGSPDAYLENALGVDIHAMRRRFLV